MAIRYIGIDPGLEGGVAALDGQGRLAITFPLPLTTWRDRRTIDGRALQVALATIMTKAGEGSVGGACGVIAIEQVSVRPGQGIRSGFSFGFGCGVIWAIAHLVPGVLDENILEVAPQEWLKQLPREYVGMGGDDHKIGTLAWARNAFGPAAIASTARRPQGHDGIADALGLAHWAWRRFSF